MSLVELFCKMFLEDEKPQHFLVARICSGSIMSNVDRCFPRRLGVHTRWPTGGEKTS